MSSVGHDPVLRVKELRKDFGQTHALRRLNLECSAGTVHTIFGENGSGKTTFLKILSGVLRPSGGEILFNGSALSRFEPRAAQELGIFGVFQEILIAPSRSVYDNIFLGYDGLFAARGVRRKTQREEMAATLISELSNRKVELHEEAGSQPLAVKQIIVLARALIRDPSVLLLDESTSALDIDARDLLFRVLEGLRKKGKIVIFISHRIDEVMEISDFVTVLNSGWSVATIARRDLSAAKLLETVSMEINGNGERDCR